MIAALGPFMRGLLYDTTARTAGIALTAKLSIADRQRLADDVPRLGLAARVGNHNLGDLAIELVAIARDGLSRVAPPALPLIEAVEEIATTRRTQSDRMVELWQAHAGDRGALIRALAHPGLSGTERSPA
jgi:glutamate--cysteine ligase